MQTMHITHRHIYYYLYLLVYFFAIVLWFECVVISTSVDTMFSYNYLRSICLICLKCDHSMIRYKNVWIDFRYFNHGRFQKKIEALKVNILIERLLEVEFERVLFLLNSLYKSLYVIG
jgi:hypothetical protein